MPNEGDDGRALSLVALRRACAPGWNRLPGKVAPSCVGAGTAPVWARGCVPEAYVLASGGWVCCASSTEGRAAPGARVQTGLDRDGGRTCVQDVLGVESGDRASQVGVEGDRSDGEPPQCNEAVARADRQAFESCGLEDRRSTFGLGASGATRERPACVQGNVKRTSLRICHLCAAKSAVGLAHGVKAFGGLGRGGDVAAAEVRRMRDIEVGPSEVEVVPAGAREEGELLDCCLNGFSGNVG